jgi:hypothetical protein
MILPNFNRKRKGEPDYIDVECEVYKILAIRKVEGIKYP